MAGLLEAGRLDLDDFLNFGHVGADDLFDRAFERYVSRGAAAAGAEHLHERGFVLDFDQPHFAAVHLDAGAHFVERRVDALRYVTVHSPS